MTHRNSDDDDGEEIEEIEEIEDEDDEIDVEEPAIPAPRATSPRSRVVTGAFGFPRVQLMNHVLERDIAFLRLLGRLEYMLTPQIYIMAYPLLAHRVFYRQLERLRAHGMIWSETISYRILERALGQGDGTDRNTTRTDEKKNPKGLGHKKKVAPPMDRPMVWMLTPLGKEALIDTEVERDQRAIDCLKTHDPAKNLARLNLSHDLQVSLWCSSILLDLRRNAFCRTVFFQIEYVVTGDQRIDALIIVRINTQRRRDVNGSYPWFDGERRLVGDREIRLALEVDRGTEHQHVIYEKGNMYRDLSGQGVYTELFGGPVLPIFLAPGPARMRAIAQEWTAAWPNTWGVISTPTAADHPEHGTLWGNYRLLTDARQEVPLCSAILVDQRGMTTVQPIMTLEQWCEGIVDRPESS